MDALGVGVSRKCQQLSAFSVPIRCVGENQLGEVGEASTLLPGHILKLTLEFSRNLKRKSFILFLPFMLHRLKPFGFTHGL